MTDTPLAVSLGDPAGIGPEVIAKSWEARSAESLPLFFAVGDMAAIQAVWDGPVAAVADPNEAGRCFEDALPVITGPVTTPEAAPDRARPTASSSESSAVRAPLRES